MVAPGSQLHSEAQQVKPSREAPGETGIAPRSRDLPRPGPQQAPTGPHGLPNLPITLPAAFLSTVMAIICFYNCKEGAGSPFPSRAIELYSAFSAYLTQRQHRTHLACIGGCHGTKAVPSIKLWDSLTARTERPLCLTGPGGVKAAPWPRVRSQSGVA